MANHELLVMGDNHGDVDSLERVVNDTQEEQFDYVIHVGDLTNTYFDGLEAGVEQLKAVEGQLQSLENRAELGLLYIYGNRDHTRGPDSEYVYERHELGVGTHIPQNDTITVGGQQFTQDPELVSDEGILVTHGVYVELFDHFSGRAYFSGHVHTGRYKDRCLNSAFLYRTDDHGADSLVGGYFVVTIDEDDKFEVDFRNLGRLKKLICPKHNERGVLFPPDFHDCQFCYDGQLQLLQEMIQSAYYGLTHQKERDAVSEDELVEYAVGLFDNPPNDFERIFTKYVQNLGQSPLDPLVRDEQGRLTRPGNV